MSETAEEPVKFRHTIAVDFDGVIHSYTSGWQGSDVIPDPPVEGAIEWLNELAKVADVVIFTTRAQTLVGLVAVQDWLIANGTPEFVVTDRKPAATVYVDDRAFRFRGVFPPPGRLIYASKPWYHREKQPPKTNPGRKERHVEYVQSLERKQHRLIIERGRLYHALISETLRNAGFEDEAVIEEWLRQNEVPWEKRLELARALRDDDE